MKRRSSKKASPSTLQHWRLLLLIALWGSFGTAFLSGVRSSCRARPLGFSRSAFAEVDDELGGGSILDDIRALNVEAERESGYATDLDLVMMQRRARELKAQHSRGVKAGLAKGHAPVLLYSVLGFLFPKSMEGPDGRYSGTYVDCTFGRGGYSEQILRKLSNSARVFAFDIDPTAIALGRELEKRDSRFRIFHRPFADMGKVLHGEDIHGIILDIGVSSPQFDQKDRGFSLQNLAEQDGPLDLRMNAGAGESASQWLQTTSVEELAWVLRYYGPDSGFSIIAERVAQAIMGEQAANGPFTSMRRFAEVVGRALMILTRSDTFEHPYSGSDHPARLYLQAIRLYLNQEKEQLRSALPAAFDLLVPGGRCLTSSFKRIESEAVFQFVMDHQEPDEETLVRIKSKRRLRELYPLLGTDLNYTVILLGEPLKASGYEINKNRRARTGSLFIMEKGPRRINRIKAKPRKELSRFKQPPPRVIIGASAEDASEDEP